MSTINKYTLLKHIISDIGILENWVVVKSKSVLDAKLKLPSSDWSEDARSRKWIKDVEDDIANRQRQLHLLKTMRGVADKL